MGPTTRSAGSPRRRLGAWLQLVFGLVFILAIVVSWQVMGRPQRHSSDHVPPNLGEMELLGSVTGSEALAQIGKLHGKGIELASGYVAEYGHGRSRATVWVGITGSDIAATGLLKEMVDGIVTGNPAFRNLRSLEIGGQTVYTVDGQGGEHYFYSRDNRVIWLTLQQGETTSVLKAAIKTF